MTILAGILKRFPPRCCPLFKQLQEINMKLDELVTNLCGVSDQLTKAQSEILAKIAALEAALADVEVPADAQAAIAALKQKAQTLDDIVPDPAPGA